MKIKYDYCGHVHGTHEVPFLCPVCADEKIKELETELDAWKTVFGTSQLTHAKAKLESLEKQLEEAIG